MARRRCRALAWAVALAWLALLPGCATTPSEVAIASRQADAPAGRGPELSAWYAITLQGPWQGDMLLDAVQTSDHRPMSVNVAAYDILETTFYDHLLSEAAAGGAPDIAYVGTPAELARLVQAGVLEPLNVCRAQHSAFDGILPAAWSVAAGRGETWGVPVIFNPDLLYFSKSRLRALGWSETAIDELPARIIAGDFTLLDLRDTAAAAVAAGVVRPGFGFMQRPSTSTRIGDYYVAFGGRVYDAEQGRLVIDEDALAAAYAFRRELPAEDIIAPFLLDGSQNNWSSRLLWNDAIGHGRALFWYGKLHDWRKWLVVAARSGGETMPGQPALDADDVGLAPFPSAVAGQPGTLAAHAGYFVILNEAATGRRLQDEACALLAQAMTPAIHVAALPDSGLFSTLALSPDAQRRMLSGYPGGIELLLDNLKTWPSYIDHDVMNYETILANYAWETQRGQLTPADAASQAVRQLRRTLGDDLIVE